MLKVLSIHSWIPSILSVKLNINLFDYLENKYILMSIPQNMSISTCHLSMFIFRLIAINNHSDLSLVEIPTVLSTLCWVMMIYRLRLCLLQLKIKHITIFFIVQYSFIVCVSSCFIIYGRVMALYHLKFVHLGL